MIRLKSLSGKSYEPDSAFQHDPLRHYLMQSVDSNTMQNLSHYEHLSLIVFASNADQLLLRQQDITSPSLAPERNSNPSYQQLINELL